MEDLLEVIINDVLFEERLANQLHCGIQYKIWMYPGIRKYWYLFEDSNQHLSSFHHELFCASSTGDHHLLHSNEHPGSYHAESYYDLHSKLKMSILLRCLTYNKDRNHLANMHQL